MHVNGEILMKLFGTRDPLEKLLDRFELDKDFGWPKIMLIVIFDSMVYLLLFAILIITLPMLLPVFILVLLQKPLLFVLTVLESLIHSPFGTETTKDSNVSIDKRIRTPWDYGIQRSHKDWD
jgi:hypothetical protein